MPRIKNNTPLDQVIIENSKPNESGCWIWQKYKTKLGYGRLMLKGKVVMAHRASYECFIGPIPPGMSVCHGCDVRACVNPDHLWLGTQAENIKDMDNKGRRRSRDSRGEKSGLAKLTDEKVLEIRARHAVGGVSQAGLSKEFGISKALTCLIINRQRWRHI
jgi:hypothetical protein